MQFPAVDFLLEKKLYHIQSEEYSHGKEQKKSPQRKLLAGSMGRRLPTLPPRLGQYHRHKRV